MVRPCLSVSNLNILTISLVNKAKDTGLLAKLNEWKGGSFQDKINKMDAKFLLVKIAQSKAFKDAFSVYNPLSQQTRSNVRFQPSKSRTERHRKTRSSPT